MIRLAGSLVCISLALAACTHGGSGPAAWTGGLSNTDLATESDESPQQRRARLRIELAAAYFDQGQTLVALDEVKQALLADPGFADAYNLRGLVCMAANAASSSSVTSTGSGALGGVITASVTRGAMGSGSSSCTQPPVP